MTEQELKDAITSACEADYKHAMAAPKHNFEVSYEEPQVDVAAEPATEAPAETAEAGSNNTAPIVIGIVVIAAAVVIIIVVAKKNAKNK